MDNSRKVELDLLRILACFAVIIIHVPLGLGLSNYEGSSFIYQVGIVFNSLCRWSIPVFTMISGCFLLDPNKNINIKDLYYKNIFRIVRVFIFWSIVYATFNLKDNFDLKLFILKVMNGEWHMWYLFMIIGLYIITPILRVVICNIDKKTLEYWIILMFIFSILVPFFRMIPNIESITDYVFTQLKIEFLGGYTIYYILGYYLYKYDISEKNQNIIYIVGAISLLFTCIVNIFLAKYVSKDIGVNGYLCLNVFLTSIAIFVFFRYKVSNLKIIKKYSRPILDISYKTLGIYLIHVLLINIISNSINNVSNITVFIIIPSVSVVVFILGYFVVSLFAKIKYLNKFLL